MPIKKIFLMIIGLPLFAWAENDGFASAYQINFTTPSKNIVCGGDMLASYDEFEWHGVSCFISDVKGTPPLKRPTNCEFDWGQEFNISDKGKADMACYSDYPYHSHPPVLAYGKTVRGKGWQCRSSKQGVRCVNRDKRGFEISKNKQVFF